VLASPAHADDRMFVAVLGPLSLPIFEATSATTDFPMGSYLLV
jgi:hypothetical protein